MEFWTEHSCIKVADLAQELAFYREALGFEPCFVCHHTAEITSAFVGRPEGGVLLQLLELPGYVPAQQSYGHFAVGTDDLDAAHVCHAAMGCATGEILDQGYQRSYFIRDPEGYETEIIQPKKAP